MLSVVRQPYHAPLLRYLGRWIRSVLPTVPYTSSWKNQWRTEAGTCSSALRGTLWLCGIELPPRNSCPSNRGGGTTSQQIPPNNVTATWSPRSYLSGFWWTVMLTKVGEVLQRSAPVTGSVSPARFPPSASRKPPRTRTAIHIRPTWGPLALDVTRHVDIESVRFLRAPLPSVHATQGECFNSRTTHRTDFPQS